MSTKSGARGDRFPLPDSMTLEDAREILRARSAASDLILEDVLRVARCDAARADAILRALSEAGYLTPALAPHQLLRWDLTPFGVQLALSRKGKRIDRSTVDATISQLVARARALNADPDRLQRVTLKLFGSALEDREDYGDVDISISLYQRKLSESERERITAALVARQSDHEKQTILGKINGDLVQDTREIRAVLRKGLPHLSLMGDDPEDLGTPYRWLVDHDRTLDRPVEVSDAVVRPNAPPLDATPVAAALPVATIMKARHRGIAATTKVPADDLHVMIEDAERLEAELWTPKVTPSMDLAPNDLRHDPRIRLAGFQHLCPVWKTPIGGVAMLREALEWCALNKVWVKDAVPFVSISRSRGSNTIRLGAFGRHLRVSVGKRGLAGSLMTNTRRRVSRIDLAGAYAVAHALGAMYREARCADMAPFEAELYLPELGCDRLPDFRKLARVGEMSEAGLPGLVRFASHSDPDVDT